MRKTLKLGDQCGAVAVLQGILTVRNIMRDGQTTLDDRFESGTQQGVKEVQAYAIGRGFKGIQVMGELDQPTIAAILLYLGVDLESLPDAFWPTA